MLGNRASAQEEHFTTNNETLEEGNFPLVSFPQKNVWSFVVILAKRIVELRKQVFYKALCRKKIFEDSVLKSATVITWRKFLNQILEVNKYNDFRNKLSNLYSFIHFSLTLFCIW